MLLILQLILKYILSICFIITLVFILLGVLSLIYHTVQNKNNKKILTFNTIQQ